jgi:transposase
MNVKNYNQDQNLLFPLHLKDFLPDDHQAMIINDIVETLDLSCLYRKVSSEGNPAYHPKMMLKILIYAYANGIFSSRKIQAAVQESVAFIFLAAWQKPDFRTISDFRKDNLAEFRTLFGLVVDMCRGLGIVSLGHIAIDGSKFKANASDKRTYDKKRINKAINKLLKQADQIDCREDQVFGPDNAGDQLPEKIRRQKDRLEKLHQIKEQLNHSENNNINATDPDAVFMKTSDGIKTSYNGQVAAEQSHNIILAADVSNEPSDTEQLVPMVDQTQKRIGPLDKLSADSGYK